MIQKRRRKPTLEPGVVAEARSSLEKPVRNRQGRNHEDATLRDPPCDIRVCSAFAPHVRQAINAGGQRDFHISF
jgi:hypothetical protein